MSRKTTIFLYILIVALFASIICFVFRGKAPTFSSFLEMLSNAPTVEIDFSFSSIPLGDWGIFNGFRDFVGGFMSVLDFFGLIVANLVYFVSYCFYFLRWVMFG